jgi:hypothetical protein
LGRILGLVETAGHGGDGDVDATRPIHFATADMPDRLGWQIQEHAKALLPLIEQLPPVNHDQSVDLAFRDKPRRNGWNGRR